MELREVVRGERLYDKQYRHQVLTDVANGLIELKNSKQRLSSLLSCQKALLRPTQELDESQLQYLLDTIRNQFHYYDLYDFDVIQKILLKKGVQNELEKNIKLEKVELNNLRNLVVALDKECINKESISDIKKVVKVLQDKNIKIRVAIDTLGANQSNEGYTNYLYSKRQTELLLELHNFLIGQGHKGLVIGEFVEVKSIQDLENTWDINQVVKANNRINQVVERIKKADLSPFEAMLVIHKVATSFAYNKKENNFVETGRVLPSIFEGETIVCSGYASFVKAVIDKLNMDKILNGTLTCEFVGCTIDYTDQDGNIIDDAAHCHNLIHIEDSKYGIKGYYMEDACWDCASPNHIGNENGKGFANCLYPVSDLLTLDKKIYKHQAKKGRADNVLRTKRRSEFINDTIETIAKIVERHRIPDVVLKNGLNSKPIKLETYRQGLETALFKVGRITKDQAKIAADIEINKSIARAKKMFKKKSKNAFYNADKKNKR